MTDTPVNPRSDAWRADAVRYRMLRRLVPSVNHKLAGAMQPVSLLAGMFARHLQRPQFDLATLSKQAADMQHACKAAVATRTDVMSWFHSSEQKWVSLVNEAQQCAWLLTAEFAILGCSIDNQIADAPGIVLQDIARAMCMVMLFAILDNAEGPVSVQLRSLPTSQSGESILASWSPLAASDIWRSIDSGHKISWDDLQAVADDLEVRLQRSAAQIEMTFKLAT